MLTINRETRAAQLQLGVVVVYMLLVLATGYVDLRQFLQLWVTYTSGGYFLWFLMGLGAAVTLLGCRVWRREPLVSPTLFLKDQLMARWERDRFASLLVPPLVLGTLMSAFNAFKGIVLPHAGFRDDALLTQIDRALFLGTDPWRVTHSLFGSAGMTELIDHLYHGWFYLMPVGIILAAWLPKNTWRLRTQFIATYIGVWIVIGSVFAWFLPAAGPCFVPFLVDPQSSFAALNAKLALINATHPLQALGNQEFLLEALHGTKLSPGEGISAMPSVHNALAMLFARAAFAINRKFGWVMALYAFIIWIGSIHLGWHYAIDGIVSLALTMGLWHASGWLADWLEAGAKDGDCVRAPSGLAV